MKLCDKYKCNAEIRSLKSWKCFAFDETQTLIVSLPLEVTHQRDVIWRVRDARQGHTGRDLLKAGQRNHLLHLQHMRLHKNIVQTALEAPDVVGESRDPTSTGQMERVHQSHLDLLLRPTGGPVAMILRDRSLTDELEETGGGSAVEITQEYEPGPGMLLHHNLLHVFESHCNLNQSNVSSWTHSRLSETTAKVIIFTLILTFRVPVQVCVSHT